MAIQTKFKFEDGIYNFWLIEWIDSAKGSTLIRCEELQTPMVRITQIQAERDIRYRSGELVDRFFAPWKSLTPCVIENQGHLNRVRGWLIKFGEKNNYSGFAVSSRGEITFGYLDENEQLNLFDKKVEILVDNKPSLI